MSKMDKEMKWHKMDEIAASELIQHTQSPDLVYPIPISMLPASLQKIPGVISYYVSNYLNPMELNNNLTVGGVLMIARTEGETAKAYNFVIATAGDGNVYFNGPYKDFENHHFDKNSSVPVKSLFGHIPFPDRGDT